MQDGQITTKELLDRVRSSEARECELATAERDPKQREIHFLRAAVHAAHMLLLKRLDQDADESTVTLIKAFAVA